MLLPGNKPLKPPGEIRQAGGIAVDGSRDKVCVWPEPMRMVLVSVPGRWPMSIVGTAGGEFVARLIAPARCWPLPVVLL